MASLRAFLPNADIASSGGLRLDSAALILAQLIRMSATHAEATAILPNRHRRRTLRYFYTFHTPKWQDQRQPTECRNAGVPGRLLGLMGLPGNLRDA